MFDKSCQQNCIKIHITTDKVNIICINVKICANINKWRLVSYGIIHIHKTTYGGTDMNGVTQKGATGKRVLRSTEVTVGTLILSYILIAEEKTDELGERCVYSIFVECIDGSDREADIVCDVAATETEATELFLLLSGGTVTPCTLRDVICDYVADR